MAEAAKKITATATKTTQPAVEKKAATAKAPTPIKATTRKAPVAKAQKATAVTSKIHLMPPSYEQIANLAHKYWADRCHQDGFHEDDWYRAEQELRGKAS